MDIEIEIFDAAMDLLETYLGSNPLPVAYPGFNFDPPDTGQWLQVRFFPNQTGTYALKDGPFDHLGFIQITACQRPGSGIKSLLTLASDIKSLYPYTLSLGPGRVRSEPWVSDIIEDSDRLLCPVTIRYRASS